MKNVKHILLSIIIACPVLGANAAILDTQTHLVPSNKGAFQTNNYRNLFVEMGYSKKRVDNKLNEVFKENVRQMNIETYKEIVREVFKLEVDDKFQHVTVPVKVLAGSRESRAIRNSVTAFPKVMPNAEGKIIDDEVHAWNIINPYKFNVELRNWLDRA